MRERDRLFFGGTFLTMSDDAEPAEAVLVRDGNFYDVGRYERLSEMYREALPCPLRGQTLLPGLIDGHLHPHALATTQLSVDLTTCRGFSDVRDVLATQAQQQEAASWIIGFGLTEQNLRERRLPNANDLQAVSDSHAIVCYRQCGHVAVVNAVAAARANLPLLSKNLPAQMVEVGDDGKPTGRLYELAVSHVSRLLRYESAKLRESTARSFAHLLTHGLTTVCGIVDDVRCADSICETESLLDVAKRTAAPSLRLFLHANSVAALTTTRQFFNQSMHRLLGIKMFSDGSLGGRTAALYCPYADEVNTSGVDLMDASFREMFFESAAAGWDVAIHAIGDRANDQVLDLFEQAKRSLAHHGRFRVEHASVLSSTAVSRFAELAVIASVQPSFVGSDAPWIYQRLGGPAAVRRIYPFASLLSSGAQVLGGSDCPIENPNPFWGMYYAVHRPELAPDEALSRRDALSLFTSRAAFALGDDDRGQIAPGKRADFVVVDRNPLTCSVEQLRDTVIQETWIKGERVFKRK